MDFDPQTALSYAASIARPRRVGSGEDEKVALEIEGQLRSWGYRVERQTFVFSTTSNVFLTIVVLMSVGLVLAMLLSHQSLPLLADLAALLLLVLVVSFMSLNRVVQSLALEKNGRMLKLGRRHTTTNLIARLSLQGTHPERSAAESKDDDEAIAANGDCFASFDHTAKRRRSVQDARNDDPPHLYLVAHYDSKSQRMPLAVRIALFMMSIIFGLMLAVLTLFNVSTALYLPIGLFTLAVSVPLLFLDVGNNSPGAIDNASSVGLVLHLAEVLAQRGDWQDKLQITILIPSAEELTLMGSVAYVTVYEKHLRTQEHESGLYILNFDGVGIDGDLYYVGHSHAHESRDRISLLAHVQAACAELSLPLKPFGFIGALFDQIPFAQRGFDAISLIAVGKASRSVHTPQDSIEQLHVRGFDQAGQVALRVIDYLIRS